MGDACAPSTAPAPATAEDATAPIDVDAAQNHEPSLDAEVMYKLRTNDKAGLGKLLDEKPELLHCVDPQAKASAAHWAALEGNMAMLEDLYRRGAPMDVRSGVTGMTPLHYACYQGNLQVAQVLVKTAGCAADPCDATGATPLMVAAQHNWPRQVFWLASLYSADSRAHADRDGDTALHWASYKGALACLSLLCEFGLSPVTADKYGSNALHLAVGRNEEPNVRWLLQHREVAAMLSAKDVKGRTPVMMAEEKGLDFMMWLLTDGRLEQRAPAVQMFHRNVFSTFTNANHLFSRLSVRGMEKAVELRTSMYGAPTPPDASGSVSGGTSGGASGGDGAATRPSDASPPPQAVAEVPAVAEAGVGEAVSAEREAETPEATSSPVKGEVTGGQSSSGVRRTPDVADLD